MKRVVITGVGAVTPLGNDVDTFWNNVKKSACGIETIQCLDASKFRVSVAGEVKEFDAKKLMDRKAAKRMERFSQFAVVAANEAFVDSGIEIDKINQNRFGVVIGSGLGSMEIIEKETLKLHAKGPNRTSPMFIPKAISNMAAGNVAIQVGARGVCTNVVTACASGTHCIGEAFKMLQVGRADLILAGGTESNITPLSLAGFQALTALSENQDPKKASRPFDKERDGFVMGEGAGIVMMETLEHAEARGAKILAEVVGYGATCDAHHITSPMDNGDGGARAMQEAIDDAGIRPDEVSYINAHGTSTPVNDRTETAAIKTVFGDYAYDVPVSSTKSMIGHLLGAAGGVEAVTCIKALEEGFIPATIGYENVDEECDLDYVPTIGRRKELNYALSNSLGFGGHNATLLFKRWE